VNAVHSTLTKESTGDVNTNGEMRRRAYLAGPMRGIEEYNFPAFHQAADILRLQGWEVWSPAERDIEEDGFNPKTDKAKSMAHYMTYDLPAVCESDAVIVLPGWEKSQGARLEVHVASECGILVLAYPSLEPVEPKLERHPNSARFHEILSSLAELHDRKQADYGRGDDPFANIRASEEWGIDPWVGAMVRLNDKIRRLQSLIANGQLQNESAEDSFRDIAVYAVIALVLFEQRD
jgi:hypothetical protein